LQSVVGFGEGEDWHSGAFGYFLQSEVGVG
jgi:hypothetical protein